MSNRAEQPQGESAAVAPIRDLAKLRALACKLHQEKRLPEAVGAYQAYLAARPGDAGIWSNLGVALRAQAKLRAAALCYRRALEIEPGEPSYLGNLGNVLKDLDEIEDSIAVQREAVAQKPDDVRLRYNLGLAYREGADFEAALESFDAAIVMNPEDPHMQWDRALALLHLGRFEEGWQAYEWRWKIGELPPPSFRAPAWRGEDLEGKRILLTPEQGFGDTLLVSRLIPQVKARGATVWMECKPPLWRLFAGVAAIDRLAAPGALKEGFDYHCSLMSLPGILGVTHRTAPPPLTLAVPPVARKKARRLLAPAGDRFKVGIVWSGSVTYKGNRKRAAGLERFLDLAGVPGVQLYSLYKGPLEGQLKEQGAAGLVVDLGGQDEDLADTAAAIELLDLVIMTDSAVAHLTGTLGRPIWNLLSYSPYWLYGARGETTPWYPSMRLYRQPAPGDWDSVFARVRVDLDAAAAAKRAGAKRAGAKAG